MMVHYRSAKPRIAAAFIAALAAASAFPLAAHGTYDPKHGRWLQRDPVSPPYTMISSDGTVEDHSDPDSTRQYTDGADLYQYVKSRPAEYVDPHGLSCLCCCARGIRIQNITLIDDAHWGHRFDTIIELEYIEGGSTNGLTDCKLEWLEWTDLPYLKGMEAKTWTDMTQLPSTAATFTWWNARPKPLLGKHPVKDTDTPYLAKRLLRSTERTLAFAIRVTSGQSEACAKACGDYAVDIKTGTVVAAGSHTMYATQYLTLVYGGGGQRSLTPGVDKSLTGHEP
jgi:hypothetical protein